MTHWKSFGINSNIFFIYFVVRELVKNKLPKFYEIIFSLDEAKNAGIALATASIFNEV